MSKSQAVVPAGKTAESPVYRDQVLKATKALAVHMKKDAEEKNAASTKKSMLDDEDELSKTPVWLTLTTKRHISDTNRLQPGKIVLPHPLNTDAETTICLIVADPQRAYKDIVASDEFPAELRGRITRVIDLQHLKAKFKQYEAQRKLFSEHDIFLGDDRIINQLPKVLGSTFYKTQAKRPIPVIFRKATKSKGSEGKRLQMERKAKGKPQKEADVNARTPAQIAAEIEKAIGAALVNLSPGTNTAIKIGYAGWEPAALADNIEAVAGALVDKYVPQKWANVRSLFVKGPETAALPIWETDELWLDKAADVIADGSEAAKALEAKKEKRDERANIGKKRKSLEAGGAGDDEEEEGEEKAGKKGGKPKERAAKKARTSKTSTAKALPESNDNKLDKEIAERKAKLTRQKRSAKKAIEA